MPKKPVWHPPDLKGKIAVVTGASRGAGRAIALVLGECGATVYCAARSVRGGTTVDGMPGTVEDTAEAVAARGGRGIPVQCDTTKTDQVAALFSKVKEEQRGLDILVNNAWGGYEGHPHGFRPQHFWEYDFEPFWQKMIVSGLRAHMLPAHAAGPMMLTRPGGLIVSTIAWDRDQYIGSFYDVAKHGTVRFVYGLSRELRDAKVAALAVAPGFMRTERVLAAFKTDEQHWRDFPAMKQTESPEYTGRAIAMLAADPKLMSKSGKAFRTGDLAREYGFTDVDGRRVPPFSVKTPYEKMLRGGKSR